MSVPGSLTSGFSFPIALGVRYRVGQTQGHMQQVGTKMIVSDAGYLSVTSTRTVFSGRTSTREIPYAKLVNLTVFAIGVTECIAIAVSIIGGTVRLASHAAYVHAWIYAASSAGLAAVVALALGLRPGRSDA